MEEKQTQIALSGRIDSNNAAATEQEIFAQLKGAEKQTVILDAGELEYISSAGLRMILHLKQSYPDLRIINASSEVYEILEMTGFTEMMQVEKAYRVVSVEGCEVIGEGFNGKIYRIDQDNVVKVYKNADALAAIQHEREVARLALILGVPTAISYDVVRVGDSYGSVFELLNARAFSKILAEEPERMDWCVREYVQLLKKVHGITVPAGKLPQIKSHVLESIRRAKAYLPRSCGDKLERLIEEIPESDRMIHGDYHTKNIVLVGDEVLLIDMDTLSVGHPIFELAQMYKSFIGFSEYDEQIIKDFQGFDHATAEAFWKKSLGAYLNTRDEEKINDAEKKIRCIAYGELIDWKHRHMGAESEEDRATLALWTERLTALMEETDSLCLGLNEDDAAQPDDLEIEALTENLPQVMEFVDRRLAEIDCSTRTRLQIGVAVEEVFVNIASYAYAPGTGRATVRVGLSDDPAAVTITFLDHGVPYDPLARPDPDVALPAGSARSAAWAFS